MQEQIASVETDVQGVRETQVEQAVALNDIQTDIHALRERQAQLQLLLTVLEPHVFAGGGFEGISPEAKTLISVSAAAKNASPHTLATALLSAPAAGLLSASPTSPHRHVQPKRSAPMLPI